MREEKTKRMRVMKLISQVSWFKFEMTNECF